MNRRSFWVWLWISVHSRIMRLLLTGSFLLVAFAVSTSAEEWSWGKEKNKDQAKPVSETSDGATDRESKSIDSYAEVNDSQDGGALETNSGSGNDTQPRHLIKDRLCGLGLMEVRLLGDKQTSRAISIFFYFFFFSIRTSEA